ncbi:hypothetical protein FHL15_011183 [Xylaria flabelliformis]|uniref:ATP-dependent DNA ligase family profile domain-containing protein n=1 Tax=Xylaria flabelliformis TaxID=2512241 RepID=A0A553HIZ6_9PEZI|nr:hypothetical protein FHL15_011183 [Xylaria flabelliformis]
MPFPYRYICDLLQQLDDEVRKPPAKQTPSEAIIQSWFQHYQSLIHAPGNDACAILSTLLPERRTDRVYNIQAPRLQSIFGKALMLGASRVLELRRWAESGSGVDLGDCVESILRRTPNSRDDTTHLDVEEIDETLGRIAAACRFSSPAVRAMHQTSSVCDPNALLADIYTRLGSRDAKWFTRLVLKNYLPVVMNAHVIFRNYHPLLPQFMKIRDDLSVASAFVRHINDGDARLDAPAAMADVLRPRLGTKVGRQPWFKGRSMKNCMDMARGRDVICEQKIDGEYCQIHIDLRKPRDRIQIFSKSGKDSTADRAGLHRLVSGHGKRFQVSQRLHPHVVDGGSSASSHSSSPHDYEHLMIVYYDVLLIDDESLLGIKNSERFQRLSEMVTCREGYAELVTRTTICTSRPSAVPALRELFAQCISSRGEGLVLKPDEPYFDFTTTFRPYSSCNIKLKKEYIQGWGEVGDFAVVGASYDAAKAREYRRLNVKWTHFFIGCLENEHQARARTEMPRFRVTNIVELTGPTLSAFWTQQSPISVPYKENTFIQLDYTGRALAKKPTAIFPDPLVFDMRCFGFDREPNTQFWSMRFPQVDKVHHDRSYLDTTTFSELQEIAETATNVPDEEDSQEMRQWVKALETMDRGKFSVDLLSQATTCSNSPPSPSSTASYQSTPRQPGYKLPTPPRLLAVDLAIHSTMTGSGSSRREKSSVAHQCKRRVTEHPESGHAVKRRCTRSTVFLANSSQRQSTSTLTDSSLGHTQQREPLGRLDPNASQKRRTGIVERLEDASSLSSTTTSSRDDVSFSATKPAVSSPIGYHTASEMVSSSPNRATETRRDSATARSQSKESSTYPTCCSIARYECALASCSVLLAPCISSYAWVTDDLLRRHGIVNPLLDPRVWKNKDFHSSARRSAGSSVSEPAPPSTSATRPRIRKICLVESRRAEATQAFIQKIKEVDLKRRDGGRERVTVYDWRVLEVITKEEEARKKGTDPWRRFYVGLV